MWREVEIVNELGLHARPAAEFVRCVMRFNSEITIHKGQEQYVAGSILEVLSANLDRGTRIQLQAEGPDAEEALEAISKLLEHFRHEEQGIACDCGLLSQSGHRAN